MAEINSLLPDYFDNVGKKDDDGNAISLHKTKKPGVRLEPIAGKQLSGGISTSKRNLPLNRQASSRRNLILERQQSLSKSKRDLQLMEQDGVDLKRKSIVKSLAPTVRRRGKIQPTTACKTARIYKSKSDNSNLNGTKFDYDEEDDEEDGNHMDKNDVSLRKGLEEIVQSLRTALMKNDYHVQLVQLGAEFRIMFSKEFLHIVGQFDSKLSVFILKDKAKPKMRKLEEMEEEGRMHKAKAKCVFLGDIFKKRYDEDISLSEDEEERKNPSLDSFETHSFELDENYPGLVANIMDWKGIVIAKRAEEYPISSYPGIYFHGNLDKLPGEKVADKEAFRARQTEMLQLEEKMRMASAWTPKLGLKHIRKVLKPKLRFFDRDGSGTIDFEEFKAVMENLGLFLTETRLQKLFGACDLDRSGSVELEELPLALHINDHLPQKVNLSPKDAFELFDYDGSGELNEQEFSEVLQTLSVVPMSREETTKLFAKYDQDQSGLIEYEEFREIWLSICDVEREIALRTEGAQVPLPREKPLVGRKRKKLVQRLKDLLIAEEEREEKEFSDAVEKCYHDMRALRLETDIKHQELKKIRRREALAARVAISKAERELRRQKHLEESQRARIEKKENLLRTQLDKELRYREEKERADRKAEREFQQQQEKEARAKRGEDKLDLRDQGFRIIPDEVYKGKPAQEKLAYLVNMDFSHNKLEFLPETRFLFWCGTLRRLSLAHNRLKYLPSEIEALESLQVLNLAHNHLTALPKEIGSLKSILVLDIGENELEMITPEIRLLSDTLERLSIHRNNLELLPSEVSELKSLKFLDVSLNKLIELPESIGEMTNLKHLDVSWNKMRKFPRGVGRLGSLECLDMSGNDLRRLPDAFHGLKALQVLKLGRNDLIEIPRSIDQLFMLLKLDVSGNNLYKLPTEIGNLTLLQSINISNNQVRKIPTSFGKLSKLQVLNCQNNELEAIPDEIGALTALRDLNLCENKITGSIPPSMGTLRFLESLNLAFNQVQSLPASFGALIALKTLDMTCNNLRDLPESIGCMISLETLRISRNQIKAIPRSIGKLGNCLITFDLSSNILEWLPAEIGDLHKLQRLDLHHNLLKAVPSELGKILPQLESFSVTHNPLTELPFKFASDVKTKYQSELIWSGYSDGDVADWIVQITDVHEACKNLIDLKDIQTNDDATAEDDDDEEEEAAQEEDKVSKVKPKQTLREFSGLVKASLEEKGKWRDSLMTYVVNFYAKSKELGAIARLDGVYGVEVIQRKVQIGNREKERVRICDMVKQQEEQKINRMDEVYSTSAQRLAYAKHKLDQRSRELAKQHRKETETMVKEMFRQRFPKQREIAEQMTRQREAFQAQQRQSWLQHFQTARQDFVEECKREYGYEGPPPTDILAQLLDDYEK